MANVRSAYATLVAKYLEDNAANSIAVPAKQSQADWQTTGGGVLETMVNGAISEVTYDAKTSGSYTVAISDTGVVTVS